MIINLKSKNVFVFQDIKIDFTIDSKKLENIKDNDFKEFKNSKKKKKIEIIVSNALGKSSFLEILKLFNTFYNIDNFYRTIHQNTLFDFSNKFLLKKTKWKKPIS